MWGEYGFVGNMQQIIMLLMSEFLLEYKTNNSNVKGRGLPCLC